MTLVYRPSRLPRTTSADISRASNANELCATRAAICPRCSCCSCSALLVSVPVMKCSSSIVFVALTVAVRALLVLVPSVKDARGPRTLPTVRRRAASSICPLVLVVKWDLLGSCSVFTAVLRWRGDAPFALLIGPRVCRGHAPRDGRGRHSAPKSPNEVHALRAAIRPRCFRCCCWAFLVSVPLMKDWRKATAFCDG